MFKCVNIAKNIYPEKELLALFVRVNVCDMAFVKKVLNSHNAGPRAWIKKEDGEYN